MEISPAGASAASVRVQVKQSDQLEKVVGTLVSGISEALDGTVQATAEKGQQVDVMA
jgi:hypothetical protein